MQLFKDGSCYDGKIKNLMANGTGKFTREKDSYSYEGEWLNNKPHGRGTLKIGKFFYEGNFCNGFYEGKGMIEDESFKYEG